MYLVVFFSHFHGNKSHKKYSSKINISINKTTTEKEKLSSFPLSLVHSQKLITFFFACSKGRPQPKILWHRDGEEISGVSHTSTENGVTTVVNQLFLGTVSREFYGSKLQCRAQGSKLIPYVMKEVVIQVHCKLNCSNNYNQGN